MPMDSLLELCLGRTWIAFKRKEDGKKLNPIGGSRLTNLGTCVHIDGKVLLEIIE
jgi:hypothetical protein